MSRSLNIDVNVVTVLRVFGFASIITFIALLAASTLACVRVILVEWLLISGILLLADSIGTGDIED